ncbi:MAG: proline--tRNA ligase, partial [Proteobacteria bacterium]|nr:proline--tRNA ligase [Pseudomonadota bacterium]
GRDDDYGKEMLRIKDRHKNDLLFGPTHEEVVTDIFRKNITSYKDLPKNLYQIQWKFRDEIRPRFGVMRGREFFMKDGYSFDVDFESSRKAYDLMYQTYFKIFKAMGLSAVAVKADTGAIGGDLSHEFHVLANTGESEVFYDKKFDELAKADDIDIIALQSLYAAADEMHKADSCPIDASQLASKRGIEIGHIFHFGDKYSKAMNATVTNQEGKEIFPQMGSYGIGVSRLVGAIIEASHDEAGIIWPEAVAPFKAAIINLRSGDEDCDKACEALYNKLQSNNIEVLYDDRKANAGQKFANIDLIGIPYQIVIGPRGLKDGICEVKNRKSGEKSEIALDKVIEFLG